MNLTNCSLRSAVVVAAFWFFSLSVAGQEITPGETAPTQPEAAVAPAPVADQMLESEFELLQEPTIESVSKRSESVFASPFSADVITRDMIQKAGARTIPEALRLLPGMLVYEQSSGNFDIHIRGFDNIQPGGMLQDFPSTTILVMIDYRVVYNYLLGGTFWEALPVDIVDVERIELVRGPVAALYGPNAVTGVINIITRKYTSDGLHANAQAEGALSTGDSKWKDDFSLGQYSASGRFGYKYKSLSGGASANYHSYDRLENGLYSYYLNKRIANPKDLQAFQSPNSPIPEPNVTYPDPGSAYRTVASTGFFAYEPTEKLSFNLNGGYQESRTLREFIEGGYSPFNTHESQSWYLDLRSRFYNFTFQASFNSGHQMIPGQKEDIPGRPPRERYEYKFNTLDLNLDYDFVWEWLRARPGVSFRRAQYSGLPFATWDLSTVDSIPQEKGETKEIQSASASVGLEQTLWKLRFIEAIRLDVYFDRTENSYYNLRPYDSPNPITPTTPTTRHGRRLYPSFQVAVTYAPAEDHLLRVSFARASKSPSMVESFYDDTTFKIGGMKGNNALNLLTFDTLELGYRARISQQIDLSIEVFGTRAYDFSNLYFHGITIIQNKTTLVFQYDNLDLEARQLGSTISAGFTSRRLQGRVFATVQMTQLYRLARDIYHIYDFTYNPLDPDHQNKTQPHVGTPDVFGGFYVNYQPVDRLNINLNAYYFSRRTQIHNDLPKGTPFEPNYDPQWSDIQQSFLLNAKVSYNVWNGLTAYVSVRNLFNINQEQFIWGDANHILCFFGLQYDL